MVLVFRLVLHNTHSVVRPFVSPHIYIPQSRWPASHFDIDQARQHPLLTTVIPAQGRCVQPIVPHGKSQVFAGVDHAARLLASAAQYTLHREIVCLRRTYTFVRVVYRLE